MYSYKDYKDKISIIQVALDLGYSYDRSKGKAMPSFVLNKGGNEIDRIQIVNPHNSSIQGYFKHNGEKGDLITFITNNINSFSKINNSNNLRENINAVLEGYIGGTTPAKTFLQPFDLPIAKPFELDRYEMFQGNSFQAMYFFENRGITKQTAEVFKDNFLFIRDKQSQYNYKNIAFPYNKPGQDEILGFEIRGSKGFKSKAEGTNSKDGAWIADFTKGNDYLDKTVYLFESAYDAMSYYQINKASINLEKSVFCSTGGAFSESQIRGIYNYYNPENLKLCFDNDLIGRLYDFRLLCLLQDVKPIIKKENNNVRFIVNGREFVIADEQVNNLNLSKASGIRNYINISTHKPNQKYKDWNETIQKKDEAVQEGIKHKNTFKP